MLTPTFPQVGGQTTLIEADLEATSGVSLLPLASHGIGFLALSVVCLVVPGVGDQRFLLAGILTLGCIPMVTWLHFQFGTTRAWPEPLFDIMLVVTLVHLIPEHWHAALAVGILICMAPSISLHPQSCWIYSGFAALLLSGMSVAAFLHNVSNWQIPILATLSLYPSVIWYAKWQTTRTNRLKERSLLVRNVTQLSGGVAHDFRNLLHGILGHAELAKLELPAGHPARKSLEDVFGCIERARILCDQLTSFNSLIAIGNENRETVDFAEELRLLVRLMHPVVPDGVSFDCQLPGTPTFVSAERVEMQQVIMNVLLNAAEAYDQLPATVTIKLTTESDGKRDWVVTRIRDNGVGIESANLERIFDPYYTSKARGHGLGLASARQIMTRHGGTIEVDSRQGEGTLLTLKLRAVSQPQDTQGLPSRSAATGQPASI